jgi:hypothetical protein
MYSQKKGKRERKIDLKHFQLLRFSAPKLLDRNFADFLLNGETEDRRRQTSKEKNNGRRAHVHHATKQNTTHTFFNPETDFYRRFKPY